MSKGDNKVLFYFFYRSVVETQVIWNSWCVIATEVGNPLVLRVILARKRRLTVEVGKQYTFILFWFDEELLPQKTVDSLF